MRSSIKKINSILDNIDKNIPLSDEFSDYELTQLELFSKHEKEEIRSRVGILLANFTEERGEKILINLTKDKDSLVRAEACDSLSQSQSFGTYELLKKIATQDDDSMVRGYAISSLSKIALAINKKVEVTAFLTRRLAEERIEFTRINIYKVLYDMGEKKYLNCLIENLNDKIYQNRCAVVNLLGEIVDEYNYQPILEALEKRKEIEDTIAVNSTINKLLEKVKKMNSVKRN